MILTANPRRLITVNFGGRVFRCSQVTYANLLATQAYLDKHYPGARLVVIQPCYNTGVSASAGTHDFDAVLDVMIIGLPWDASQKVLRQCGWAAWWRHTGTWASKTRWHIHMISLAAVKAGCTVGLYIDGGLSTQGRIVASSQVTDYYHHALGLAGQHDSGDDRTWHPRDIDSTVFDYATWRLDMPYRDWPKADRAALVKDVAEAVRDSILNADMNALEPKGTAMFQGVTFRDAVKGIFRAVKAKA